MILLTDDCGRRLDDAPRQAPTDGFIVEVYWCNRADCPPHRAFAASLADAEQAFGSEDAKAIPQENGRYLLNCTARGCVESGAIITPVAAGAGLA
jgi:hypothetical protein